MNPRSTWMLAVAFAAASSASAATIAFEDHVEYSTRPFPLNLAFADFDGDGDLDMAATSQDDEAPIEISVLLNLGGGTFASWAPVASGVVTRSIGAGDMDGDGDADLLIGPIDGDFRAGILLNDGHGNFGAPQMLVPMTGRTDVIAAHDVDGDEDLDIVLGEVGGPDEIVVVSNLGGGVFGAPAGFGGASSAYFLHVAFGDVDGDDDVDLAVGRSLSGDASIYRNSGGTFVEQNIAAVPFSYAGNDLGDVDGDGDLDLAMVSEVGSSLLLLKNTGGVFTPWNTFSAGVETQLGSDVNLADFDRDGRCEAMIAGANTARFATLHGAGASGFEAPVFHELGWLARSLSAADLDGDQNLDVAAALFLHHQVDVLLNETPAGTGAGELAGGAARFSFGPARPNPVRVSTSIPLELPATERVRISVLDVSGRRVRSLFDGTQPSGRQLVTWDGRDDTGRAVAAGVYIVELHGENRRGTTRVVVMD